MKQAKAKIHHHMQAKPKMHLTLDQTLDQIMKAKCHPNIDKMHANMQAKAKIQHQMKQANMQAKAKLNQVITPKGIAKR